jgi:hypothetical protein
MIKFHCKSCGVRIRVPKVHAGKKGKCPRCKNIVIVPRAEQTDAPTSRTDFSDSRVSSKNSNLKLTFLDIPQKDSPPPQPTNQDYVSDASFERTQYLEESTGLKTVEPEPVPERKLPWLIDIFFYPTSKPGLTTLGIIVGIPLLFRGFVFIFGILALRFPPALVFLALFAIVGLIVKIVLYLYMYWYLCACIRDSASGGIRAPETLAVTPGLGEIFWQTLRIIACLAFFALPAVAYSHNTKQTDAIYWCLVVYAVFFFPMGLLSVVMFDSVSGLNPVLLIGSIFSTFLPYCALVLLYTVGVLLCVLDVLIQIFTAIFLALPVLGPILLPISLQFFGIYMLFIAAHVLGRFHWRYQEKLNWEV